MAAVPSVAMGTHLKTTEERFWALIAERRREGADRTAVDQRIWDLYGDEWSIMFTDLAGFSRRVDAFGIIEFLELILEQREQLQPVIAAHDGVLVKEEADSMLLLFRRPQRALACALAMQARCRELNVGRPPEEELLLCLGLGHGRILRIGDVDVYGAEVNAASKLGEDVARAHEILVTPGFAAAIGEIAGYRLTAIDDPRVVGASRLVAA
jgi:adenylate cyclase